MPTSAGSDGGKEVRRISCHSFDIWPEIESNYIGDIHIGGGVYITYIVLAIKYVKK